MCGDYDSVIGMVKDEPMRRFLTKMASGRFEAATGPALMSGLAVETDDKTGLALKAAPVRIGTGLSETQPDFWS
jgi:calcineurin-like phosphoesterase